MFVRSRLMAACGALRVDGRAGKGTGAAGCNCLSQGCLEVWMYGVLVHAGAQLVVVHLQPDLEVGAPGRGAPLQQGRPHHIHHLQVLLGVVHHRRAHLALQAEPHLRRPVFISSPAAAVLEVGWWIPC